MKTFHDNQNREWSVSITVATAKKVKDLAGVDLMTAVGGDLFTRLASDPILLCDVLYVVCKTEADARGITDEQFGAGLAGDELEKATDAFLNALIDFFPSGKRRVLAEALARTKKTEARAIEMAIKAIDSGAMDYLMEKELAEASDQLSQLISGGSSTNTPALSV